MNFLIFNTINLEDNIFQKNNTLICMNRYVLQEILKIILEVEHETHLVSYELYKSKGIQIFFCDGNEIKEEHETIQDFINSLNLQENYYEQINILNDLFIPLPDLFEVFINTSNLQIIYTFEEDTIQGDNLVDIIEFCKHYIIQQKIKNIRNIQNNNNTIIEFDNEKIYLHGGGPTATILFGILIIFLQQNRQIKKFSGSSMGALITSFFYIYSDNLSISHERCLDKIRETCEYHDPNSTPILNRETTTNFLENLIESKYLNATLLELHNLFPTKELDIIVTKLSNMQCCILNYQNTPNVLLKDAILASCSIPYVTGITTINNIKYIDGDLTSSEYMKLNNCHCFKLLHPVSSNNKKEEDIEYNFGAMSVLNVFKNFFEVLIKDIKNNMTHNYGKKYEIPARESLQLLTLNPPLGTYDFHILNVQYGIDWAIENL